MKNMTKSEMAVKMGVSIDTFRRFISRPPLIDNLLAAGYKRKQRILSPKIISIILDEWGEFNDE